MTLKPIDPRLLRTFVAVAREGHVSRAASRLFLSQPAISLQLRELQDALKVTLFTRTARGVQMTDAGRTLLPHAERALCSLDDFSLAASQISSSVRHRLRVGTILDPEFTRLGAFLGELVRISPNIEPELQHGMSGTTLGRMLRGELDVGFYVGGWEPEASIPQPAGGGTIESVLLARFAYRVIAPPGWQQQVANRSWPELVELPWIGTPDDSVHSRLLASALQPLGLQIRRVAMVDQEVSMLAMVRSGIGLALARDSMAMQASQSDGIFIADRIRLEAQLCFLVRRHSLPHTAVLAALESIARVWHLHADEKGISPAGNNFVQRRDHEQLSVRNVHFDAENVSRT